MVYHFCGFENQHCINPWTPWKNNEKNTVTTTLVFPRVNNSINSLWTPNAQLQAGGATNRQPYIWVIYNNSPTWNVGLFWETCPQITVSCLFSPRYIYHKSYSICTYNPNFANVSGQPLVLQGGAPVSYIAKLVQKLSNFTRLYDRYIILVGWALVLLHWWITGLYLVK